MLTTLLTLTTTVTCTSTGRSSHQDAAGSWTSFRGSPVWFLVATKFRNLPLQVHVTARASALEPEPNAGTGNEAEEHEQLGALLITPWNPFHGGVTDLKRGFTSVEAQRTCWLRGLLPDPCLPACSFAVTTDAGRTMAAPWTHLGTTSPASRGHMRTSFPENRTGPCCNRGVIGVFELYKLVLCSNATLS